MKEIQAHKILAALEKWCEGNQNRVTAFSKGPNGWRVQLIDTDDFRSFGGHDLQDALAQAAQVVLSEEA